MKSVKGFRFILAELPEWQLRQNETKTFHALFTVSDSTQQSPTTPKLGSKEFSTEASMSRKYAYLLSYQ